MKLSLLLRPILLGLILFAAASLPPAKAGSATWSANPIGGDWNTAANWTPNTVPNGPNDVATFNSSAITDVTFSADTTVASLVFNPGASSYTVSPSAPSTLTVVGTGIENDSGVIQKFVNIPGQGGVNFAGSATAGSSTDFTGPQDFDDNASAGNGNFTLSGLSFFSGSSTAGAANFHVTSGGFIANTLQFAVSSNAGTAVITIQGASTENGMGGIVSIRDGSDATQSTITAQGATAPSFNGHGQVAFSSSADASSATLIATGGTNGGNGGRIFFSDTSSGDLARLELFSNGGLDIGFHHHGGVGVGSIEGNGLVFLGDLPLTIAGSLSTTFSGIIQDGGISGRTGGSLLYSGGGTLTLSGANTYTGGTTITSGTLVAANLTGSATGTAAVQVNAGTLGGGGIVAGETTVGSGSGPGAFLAPAAGITTHARLTIQKALALNSDATYIYTFKANMKHARTDLVFANKVTINGATIAINAITTGRMKRGLVLNVISNTNANPISGTFANLPDGAVVNVNGNNLQADYEGGDGNDLTLTVVP